MNLVPPWDFDAPDDGQTAPRDSSAAAITASGLFDLAGILCRDADLKGIAIEALARTILEDALHASNFSHEQNAGLGRHLAARRLSSSERSWASMNRSRGAMLPGPEATVKACNEPVFVWQQ